MWGSLDFTLDDGTRPITAHGPDFKSTNLSHVNTIKSGMIFVVSATARWAMQLGVQWVWHLMAGWLPFKVLGVFTGNFAHDLL